MTCTLDTIDSFHKTIGIKIIADKKKRKRNCKARYILEIPVQIFILCIMIVHDRILFFVNALLHFFISYIDRVYYKIFLTRVDVL